ncbi:CoA-binding protein [Kiloniella laminariae]|uniref:CoA-binding protein n=1 Tax=Kiloniella laminariae TaxID=454162 RepID=A0ABT4LEX0_9PROT|nr:CoA-binding protein [Kiloniella laminariae]MCZ4279658.1 CoA-binding protein [Kiloniella laminariae]
MDHNHAGDSYSDDYLRKILQETRNIALVGASDKPHRASNSVFGFLLQQGYDVFPVNPALAGSGVRSQGGAPCLIWGRSCHASLASLKASGQDIDMVDVFRSSDAALEVTKEAIAVGAKVVWMQLEIVNHEAAALAEAAGLKVVMNRCPAIEIPRLAGLGLL